MREIRFRAWDNQEKEMLYSDPELSADFNIFVGWWNNETDKSRIILMQYTALKDKNGKEIYEGDIVRNELDESEVFEVEFTPSWFHKVKEFGFLSVYEEKASLEVIGNIYENPELLQGGKV